MEYQLPPIIRVDKSFYEQSAFKKFFFLPLKKPIPPKIGCYLNDATDQSYYCLLDENNNYIDDYAPNGEKIPCGLEALPCPY